MRIARANILLKKIYEIMIKENFITLQKFSLTYIIRKYWELDGINSKEYKEIFPDYIDEESINFLEKVFKF